MQFPFLPLQTQINHYSIAMQLFYRGLNMQIPNFNQRISSDMGFCKINNEFNSKIEYQDHELKLENPINLKFQANIAIKPEASNKKSPREQLPQIHSNTCCSGQTGFERHLKIEIDKMLNLILLYIGENENNKYIEAFRKNYLHDPFLLQVYDKLVIKYFSAKKCKEDLIRYILRKAFKVIKSTIMSKEKINSQKASLILCKKYFKNSQIGIENEGELLEFFMPYNKKSKNKTMNSTFVAELFSSEDFYKDYQEIFLPKFASILITDNNKKKERLIKLIVECIQNNSILKLGTFNRYPWIDTWVEETKNIAFSLLTTDQRLQFIYKKYNSS